MNKKYQLCNECNHIRLNGEKTRFKTISISNDQLQQTSNKNRFSLKKTSKKQSVFNQELKKVKNDISQSAFDRGEYYCEGCGETHEHLDRSHIISIRRNKSLATEKRNIRLLCRKCHERWESRDLDKMKQLLCYEADIQYIYEKDQQWFHLLGLNIV